MDIDVKKMQLMCEVSMSCIFFFTIVTVQNGKADIRNVCLRFIGVPIILK